MEWSPPWYLFFLPPMDAGEAELSIAEEVVYNDRRALKILFIARSSGTLANLAGVKVNDHYEFITDPETFCTFAVNKKEREGKRKRDINIVYLPESRRLHIREVDVAFDPPKLKRDEYLDDIPDCVKDLFSALYYARRREFHVGDRYSSIVGNNARVHKVEARVEKNETVQTPAGKFRVWKVNTEALVGGLFKEGGYFRMWLTADEKKVPVQFEAKVSVGKVTGKLKNGRY